MKRALSRCALGFGIATLAVLAELLLWSTLPPTPFLFLYPAVAVAAWFGGRQAGATATLVSCVALTYWFLPPSPGFAVGAWRDVLDLALFSAMSLLVVELIERQRQALRAAEAAILARDTVLAVVAHDLRNPLQTIGLTADLLADGLTGQDERAGPRLARIRDAAERARRLIDNVLDSARLETTIPFPLTRSVSSVSALVGESLSPFKPIAEARSVDVSLPSPDALAGTVVCDHDRIVQVLSNLVSNALQYTPRGGKLAVDVRRDPEGVRFVVSDSGVGMTRDEVSHAFDRLWHGYGPGHGSGLGLWIAKGLVEAHSGKIEATSEPGRGTRMTFVLPQA